MRFLIALLFFLCFGASEPIASLYLQLSANPQNQQTPGQTDQGHNSTQEKADLKQSSRELDQISQSWLKAIHSRSERQNPAATKENDQSSPSPTQQPASPKKLRLADPGKAQTQGQAAADPDALRRPLRSNSPSEEGPSFLAAILRFTLLICLLVVVFYVGRRVFRFRRGGAFRRGDDLVQLLISIPLIQGKFLQVVDVAGQLLVLGVSDSGVQLLTNIDEGTTSDRIRLWQSRQTFETSTPNFMERLTAVLKGTDLRFWGTETNTKKSFADRLEQFTTGRGSNAHSTDEAAELKLLLKQQKRHLSQMKESPSEMT